MNMIPLRITLPSAVGARHRVFHLSACHYCWDWFIRTARQHRNNNRQNQLHCCSAYCSRQIAARANASNPNLNNCKTRLNLGKKHNAPGYAAGPEHRKARLWRLRDPDGRVHEFHNLTSFIRNNPQLFDARDVVWKPTKPGSSMARCLAQNLSCLSPRQKNPRVGSWKGWTWVSIHERRFNDGKDLLARNPQ
jgi:hypothetical protein